MGLRRVRLHVRISSASISAKGRVSRLARASDRVERRMRGREVVVVAAVGVKDCSRVRRLLRVAEVGVNHGNQ